MFCLIVCDNGVNMIFESFICLRKLYFFRDNIFFKDILFQLQLAAIFKNLFLKYYIDSNVYIKNTIKTNSNENHVF